MQFAYDERTEEPRARLLAFMDSHVHPAQCEARLAPLLAGRIRSAFAMTEPDLASSDARDIATAIVRDGDHYVIAWLMDTVGNQGAHTEIQAIKIATPSAVE